MRNVAGLGGSALALAMGVLGAGCPGLVTVGGGSADGGEADAGQSTGVGDSARDGPWESAGGSSSSSGGGSSAAASSGSASGSSSTSGSSGSSGASSSYDGTVGKGCQTNADCSSPGGPGLAVCSNSAFANPIWPTAVCILPTCDPVGNGNGAVQFCDGSPTDSQAPGVCVPTTNPPAVGMGVCMPQCRFGRDGSPPTGCIGKDVCNYAGAASTASGTRIGTGYCFGGCTSDADCPSDSSCQVDEGICLRTLYTRTKLFRQACTGSDTTSGFCNCDTGTTAPFGVCTQWCTVGGAPCPSETVCDSGETTTLVGPGDAGSVAWIPRQNVGMAGVCRVSCSPSSAGGVDGGVCRITVTCDTGESVGPVCIP